MIGAGVIVRVKILSGEKMNNSGPPSAPLKISALGAVSRVTLGVAAKADHELKQCFRGLHLEETRVNRVFM